MLDEVKEKRKETWKEKYGADNPFAAEEVKENLKNYWQQKHGVDNPFAAEEVKKKMESAGLEYIPERVFYVMHYDGIELRDIEGRLYSEYKEAGKLGSQEEADALQTLKAVREQMAIIRAQNEVFNRTISINTGGVVAASALIVLIPAFILYKRVAPALFGWY
jgi:hypothetical protein